jgi:hypothetical protein
MRVARQQRQQGFRVESGSHYGEFWEGQGNPEQPMESWRTVNGKAVTLVLPEIVVI